MPCHADLVATRCLVFQMLSHLKLRGLFQYVKFQCCNAVSRRCRWPPEWHHSCYVFTERTRSSVELSADMSRNEIDGHCIL